MPQRLAARLITGPLAFLLGGLIDLAALARAQWRERRQRRERPSS